MKPMFDTPSDKGVSEITVTPDCVTKGAEPLITKGKKKAKA